MAWSFVGKYEQVSTYVLMENSIVSKQQTLERKL